ncbi:arylsulfatase [Dietzia alimentaria]|uniref:arylsulfatase n=1 Tax=Dietzia alimentaria TaxID=665550 RepID=UPI00029A672C|nr:arylsulfatase [Dietzia alimentaria]
MPGSPAPRPNILVVVVDDLGYSDIEPFGGEIRTPVLQQLADRGARFRQFHTSSLCAPTRAMLLSGCDNHQAGLGVMQPLHAMNQYMQPGYEGYLNHSVPTMAELLRDGGYRTYMAGKWHVGITEDTRPAARGFERSYAFLGGGASHFADATPLSGQEARQTMYAEDDRFITDDLPEDFYTSTAFVDKLLEYIGDHDDDAPYFGYLAFTAPHDPLHVPDEWLDRYAGRYDDGYEPIKAERLARMKEIGLVASEVEVNPGSGLFAAWDDLSGDDRRRQARAMEIYASMVERIDHELGRLFDALDARGDLDDTVVFFLSDNGANPKQPWFYRPNTEESIERDFDNSLENFGRRGSFISMGGAWAEVAGTPLSYFKTTTYEGGTQTPLIIAGGAVTRSGVVTDEVLHVADILPTVLDLAGIDRPTRIGGKTVPPLYGRSLAPMLTGATRQPVRTGMDAICFEMLGCRSVITGDGWKLLWMEPPYGDGDRWQLFNLGDDPREMHDLAGDMPGKVAQLEGQWNAYAEYVGLIESDGTSAADELGIDRFFEFRLGDD